MPIDCQKIGEMEDSFDIDMMELAELLSDKPIYATSGNSESVNDCHSVHTLGKEYRRALTPIKTTKRFKKRERSIVVKTMFKKGMSVKEALGAWDQKPNMSRRPKTDVLVAFPSFDKCDSLVYFPHTIVRYLNASDIDAASKLLNKYMNKSCKITLNGKNVSELSLDNYKQIMTVGNDLEPDRVMCVHSTKVVENHIMATIYLKVTDVQSLYTSLSRTSDMFNDETFKRIGMFPDRAQRFQYYASESPHNEALTQELMSFAQLEENVLIYMRVDFTLTVDPYTKKIVHFTHGYEITSVHLAGSDVVVK